MVSNNGKNTQPVSSPRLEALMSFLDLKQLFITVPTHVLLSLGGTKRLNRTKPRFPPWGIGNQDVPSTLE